MAILLPHIEDTTLTHYISPKGEFTRFIDDEHYEKMVRVWGLSNTKQIKQEFWYKGKDYQRVVTIEGYETYGVTGEFHTLVIKFHDGQLSCIHPAYLKEMQSSSFGKESNAPKEDDEVTETPVLKTKKSSTPKEQQKTEVREKPTKKKETKPTVVLPTEKIHFHAKVKQFSFRWNNFAEENEEVVILEQVNVQAEEPFTLDIAWCTHSKTLKKHELQPGDMLSFDGKIVKQNLQKGKDIEDEAYLIEEKVVYKVNNPSKIQKN